MPKNKPHNHTSGGAHSHAAVHKRHSPLSMDKVKIKRVKRDKKLVTTGEKILAGIGVGGVLMGGAGAISGKDASSKIVSTQAQNQGSVSSKIKESLANIFGVPTAKADAPIDLTGTSDTSSGDVENSDSTTSNTTNTGTTTNNANTTVANTGSGSTSASPIDLTGTSDSNNGGDVENADSTTSNTTTSNTSASATPLDLTGTSDSNNGGDTESMTDPAATTTNPANAGAFSLSANVLNMQVGYVQTVTPSSPNISVSASSTNILINVNAQTGVITIIGVAPTGSSPAVITVHPGSLAANDTSQDQQIVVNVAAASSDNLSINLDSSAPIDLTGTSDNGSGDIQTTDSAVLSLSSTSLNMSPGSVDSSITVSETVNGVTDGNVTASISNPGIISSATVNPNTGILTIVSGSTPGTAFVTLHPNALGSDVSQDQQIQINVVAQASGGVIYNNNGGIDYAASGSVATFGSVTTQPFGDSGLQMPAGYPASTGSTGLNDSGLQMQDNYQAVSGQTQQQVQGAQVSAGTYTIKKGDNLWNIAKKFYGNGSQWRKILAANPNCLSQPGNTKTLKVGFVLTIPANTINF